MTHHDAGESNFHIFYQLLAGASAEESVDWNVAGTENGMFSYISDDVDRRSHNDMAAFVATKTAMSNVGLPIKDQNAIFQTVAALLHLGNVSLEDCRAVMEAEAAASKALQTVARLLQVPLVELADRLAHRTISIGLEIFKKPMSEADFASFRDSLAKSIYAGLVRMPVVWVCACNCACLLEYVCL